MSRLRVLVLAAIASVAATVVPSAGAWAADAGTISCGDQVTSNLVLTADLACTGDALDVTAPGVTIDLNGFRISGDGSGTGITTFGDATIKNGSIKGFAIGVSAPGGAVRIARVTLADNTFGVQNRGARLDVRDSRFVRNETGLAQGSGTTTVSWSSFVRNGIGASCSNSRLDVRSSRFVGNTVGLNSRLCDHRVVRNRFVDGAIGASVAPLNFPIEFRSNVFARSTIGLRVSTILDGQHTISGNVFKRNGASGLVIDAPSLGTATIAVSRNVFWRNGFAPQSEVSPSGTPLTSGLWSNSTSTLTANRSDANAGLGIDAAAAVDGGGNRARSNGDVRQCVGVTCSRWPTPSR